jgi:hypothetical protein
MVRAGIGANFLIFVPDIVFLGAHYDPIAETVLYDELDDSVACSTLPSCHLVHRHFHRNRDADGNHTQ